MTQSSYCLRVHHRDPDDFLADLDETFTEDLRWLDAEISKRMYLVRKHADRLGKVKVGSAVIGFKQPEDVNPNELMTVVEEANPRIGD